MVVVPCLVRVHVADATVLVEMLVDQVGPDQQVAVVEHVVRGAVGQDPSLLAEHHHPIGDDRHDVQLVGGRHERAPLGGQAADEVDEHPLGARVERGRRLVEQQDRWFQRQYARDRGPLLLAARQLERCALGQALDPHRRQRLRAAAGHLLGRQAELERPEGDVVEHGRAEELDIGVLEDQADLAVEAKGILASGNRGDVPAERAHRAGGRADDAVEQLQQGRFAAAVGAEQHDLLALADVQVDAVERDVAAAVHVAHAAQGEDDRLFRLAHDTKRPATTAVAATASAAVSTSTSRAVRR